jgi:hypothetical protein
MCVSKYDHRDECDYRKKLERGLNYFKNKDLYIDIQGRLFHMGKRRDYNRDTHRLDDQEQEEIKGLFKDTKVRWHERMVIEKCIDEIVGDTDRAVCRVFVTMENLKYNVHNYNGKALIEKTALMIRDFFRCHGLGAAVEYMGPKVSRQVVKERAETGKCILSGEEVRKKVEIHVDSKAKQLVGKQISFEEYVLCMNG